MTQTPPVSPTWATAAPRARTVSTDESSTSCLTWARHAGPRPEMRSLSSRRMAARGFTGASRPATVEMTKPSRSEAAGSHPESHAPAPAYAARVGSTAGSR